MTSTRYNHGMLLDNAIDRLSVIDIQSPAPEICIKQALENVNKVWIEGAELYPSTHPDLRISIVSMRGLLKGIASDDCIYTKDVDAIKNVIAKLENARDKITEGRVVINPGFSVTGSRYIDYQNTAGNRPYKVLGGELPDNTERIEQLLDAADAFKSKLKDKIPHDQRFIIVQGIPIIAQPKGGIDEKGLRRAQVEAIRIPGAFLPKSGPGDPHQRISEAGSLLIYNQMVVGMKEEDAHNPKFIESVIQRISQRMGPHTNPLSVEKDKNPILRSSGNHLCWLWLVPNHIISSKKLSIVSAAFPWKSGTVSPSNIQTLRRELESLQDQQRILLGEGKALQPAYLTRISELMELLHPYDSGKLIEETPEQKNKRLAEKKQELIDRVNKKYSKEITQIKSLEEELKEMGPPSKTESPSISKYRKQLKGQIADLQKVINAGRDAIAKNIINKRYEPHKS